MIVSPGTHPNDLARASAALRINLILGTKKYPEGRGGLERFNRTIKGQLLCGWPGNPAIDAETLALERRIDHWGQEQYNHTSHEGLDGDTPAERFHSDHRALVIPESQDSIDEAFVTSIDCKVSNDNCISVDGSRWEMPLGHRQSTIRVFRNMIDGGLSVLHEGRRVGVKQPDLVANAHRPKSVSTSTPDPSNPPTTAADIAWERDHPPLVDDDGNYHEDG